MGQGMEGVPGNRCCRGVPAEGGPDFRLRHGNYNGNGDN
jgi:hypothetical protein